MCKIGAQSQHMRYFPGNYVITLGNAKECKK